MTGTEASNLASCRLSRTLHRAGIEIWQNTAEGRTAAERFYAHGAGTRKKIEHFLRERRRARLEKMAARTRSDPSSDAHRQEARSKAGRVQSPAIMHQSFFLDF